MVLKNDFFGFGADKERLGRKEKKRHSLMSFR